MHGPGAAPSPPGAGLMLCFDPGKHTFGIALMRGDTLLALDTLRVDKEPEDGCPARVGRAAFEWSEKARAFAAPSDKVTRVIMEWPVVYKDKRKKKHVNKNGQVKEHEPDPNDLLWLAAACGALASFFGFNVKFARPGEWKKQVPKEIMTRRILTTLAKRAGELSLVQRLVADRGEAAHHALDAAGIGLWAAGRLGRGGPA